MESKMLLRGLKVELQGLRAVWRELEKGSMGRWDERIYWWEEGVSGLRCFFYFVNLQIAIELDLLGQCYG
jgi:hypothetical protein